MLSKNGLWIFAERNGDQLAPVTLQLLTKARRIANGRPLAVILFETPTQQLETQLAQYGATEVYVGHSPVFAQAADSVYADQLALLAADNEPNTILFGATPFGRSVAPRLQAKLKTGLTADCLDLFYEADTLVQVKPSYGDNVMCEIVCPDHRPQMASVRPNTFAATPVEQPVAPVITTAELTITAPTGIRIVGEQPRVATNTGIASATKIIALGRGAGSDAIVAEAKQVANRLGAAVGVSRPLTDRPDFSVEQQIGQSGTTVAPDFILNVGISGSVQYQVGMNQSKLIVSVNRASDAPIFAQSDYTFTGDAKAFMAALAKATEAS